MQLVDAPDISDEEIRPRRLRRTVMSESSISEQDLQEIEDDEEELDEDLLESEDNNRRRRSSRLNSRRT